MAQFDFYYRQPFLSYKYHPLNHQHHLKQEDRLLKIR